MEYILILDQGTTSTRAILYDNKSNIVSKSQEDFKQIYPLFGLVEHDPNDIIMSSKNVIYSCISKANVNYSEIKALGITNQRESVVMWDKLTGQAIYNVLVWQDRRTSSYCDSLEKQGLNNMIHQKTGLKIDPYFSATKIKWLLENVPKAKQLLEENRLCVGTIDTFLMFKLSNGKIFKTDYTNASRTLLFNINTLTWDEELLKLFNIPSSILPQVYPSGNLFGYTSQDILGLKLPIMAVSGDQQSSLFGQLCLNMSEIKVTYGTGCFLLMNTQDKKVESKNGLLTTLGCSLTKKPTYALEGSVFIGGALVSWLKDELMLIDSPSQSEEYALKVKDTNGVYIVPAFVGLGAPYWYSQSRGLITGITRGCNKYHLVRACLQAIDFQVKDVIDAMEKDLCLPLKEIKVDGGASVNNFLMQFQADILSKQVIRPTNIEVTSLGVYYLAGIKSNLFTLEELKKSIKIDKVFKPSLEKEEVDELVTGWKKAIDLSLKEY